MWEEKEETVKDLTKDFARTNRSMTVTVPATYLLPLSSKSTLHFMLWNDEEGPGTYFSFVAGIWLFR